MKSNASPKNYRLSLYTGRHETPFSGLYTYADGIIKCLSNKLFNGTAELSPALVIDGSGFGISEEIKDKGEVEFKNLGNIIGRRANIFLDILSLYPSTKIMHGLCNTVPLFNRANKIVTMHDLMQGYPVIEPNTTYLKLRTRLYRLQLYLTVKLADCIIATSLKVKEHLNELYKAGDKTVIIPPPLNSIYVDAELPEKEKRVNEFIAFASKDPRKNIGMLLKSFGEFIKSNDYRLIIIANTEEVRNNLLDVLLKIEFNDKVEVRTKISQSELLNLYQTACALLFPSIDEGYGYPVYEALSQGTPVLCYSEPRYCDQISRLRLQANDFIFNLEEITVNEILEKIVEITKKEFSLHDRQHISRVVRESLSAEKYVDQLIKVYDDCLKE